METAQTSPNDGLPSTNASSTSPFLPSSSYTSPFTSESPSYEQYTITRSLNPTESAGNVSSSTQNNPLANAVQTPADDEAPSRPWADWTRQYFHHEVDDFYDNLQVIGNNEQQQQNDPSNAGTSSGVAVAVPQASNDQQIASQAPQQSPTTHQQPEQRPQTITPLQINNPGLQVNELRPDPNLRGAAYFNAVRRPSTEIDQEIDQYGTQLDAQAAADAQRDAAQAFFLDPPLPSSPWFRLPPPVPRNGPTFLDLNPPLEAPQEVFQRFLQAGDIYGGMARIQPHPQATAALQGPLGALNPPRGVKRRGYHPGGPLPGRAPLPSETPGEEGPQGTLAPHGAGKRRRLGAGGDVGAEDHEEGAGGPVESGESHVEGGGHPVTGGDGGGADDQAFQAQVEGNAASRGGAEAQGAGGKQGGPGGDDGPEIIWLSD